MYSEFRRLPKAAADVSRQPAAYTLLLPRPGLRTGYVVYQRSVVGPGDSRLTSQRRTVAAHFLRNGRGSPVSAEPPLQSTSSLSPQHQASGQHLPEETVGQHEGQQQQQQQQLSETLSEEPQHEQQGEWEQAALAAHQGASQDPSFTSSYPAASQTYGNQGAAVGSTEASSGAGGGNDAQHARPSVLLPTPTTAIGGGGGAAAVGVAGGGASGFQQGSVPGLFASAAAAVAVAAYVYTRVMRKKKVPPSGEGPAVAAAGKATSSKAPSAAAKGAAKPGGSGSGSGGSGGGGRGSSLFRTTRSPQPVADAAAAA
ncbi:hypothetical protein Agub_g11894, partial [Astrephomene gubernaculifera]